MAHNVTSTRVIRAPASPVRNHSAFSSSGNICSRTGNTLLYVKYAIIPPKKPRTVNAPNTLILPLMIFSLIVVDAACYILA